jgi:hypothetical protein
MVEAISRVIATLPPEVRQRMNWSNGQPHGVQVLGAESRRTDSGFFCCDKPYGVEFTKGMLELEKIVECIVRRRYSLILKAQYGSDLAGIIFVGEEVSKEVKRDSDIIKTWSELTGCGITTQRIDEFARSLITMAIRDIAANPQYFSTYTLTSFTFHLQTLTTKSDGYPQWFSETWLRSAIKKYAGVITKID